MRARLIPLLAAVALLAACSSSGSGDASGSPTAAEKRAVVLVSGVASMTPFTTPEQACTTGDSAGNTWAFMRDYLVAQGFAVYTAPLMDQPDQQVPAQMDDTVRGPFGGCPEQPPLDVTVTSINPPEEGGKKLAAFIGWLNTQYGITSVDVVAHSLGGIFSRNGLRELKASGSPVTVRSFTTLGSPWEPVMLAIPPYEPEKACDGFPLCMGILQALIDIKPSVRPIVMSFQPENFGPWTQAQAGVLDGVPVTLVAGTLFTKPGGSPDKWPNDAFVQESAAFARSVPDSVLPQRACVAFPFAHSRSTALLAGASEFDSITWNEAVASVVAHAIGTAGTAQQLPNRLGCPDPA